MGQREWPDPRVTSCLRKKESHLHHPQLLQRGPSLCSSLLLLLLHAAAVRCLGTHNNTTRDGVGAADSLAAVAEGAVAAAAAAAGRKSRVKSSWSRIPPRTAEIRYEPWARTSARTTQRCATVAARTGKISHRRVRQGPRRRHTALLHAWEERMRSSVVEGAAVAHRRPHILLPILRSDRPVDKSGRVAPLVRIH